MIAFRNTGICGLIKSFTAGFIFLFGTYIEITKGQDVNIEFDHLTSLNGLSQNNPLIVFQDSKGFIWVGTEDGLNMYDGYRFKIYRSDPNDSNSISGNFVRGIVEDHEGNLWIGTQDGLNKYVCEKDNFIRYHHDPDDLNSIVNSSIQRLHFGSGQKLWISTEEGISIFNLETGKIQSLRHDPSNPNSLPSNITRNIIEDSKGQVWICTFGGLVMYKPEEDKFLIFTHNPSDPYSISSNRTQEVFMDSRNRIWVGTLENGLNMMADPEQGRFVRYIATPDNKNGLSNNFVNSLAEDKNNIIWVGTSAGLCYYHESGDRFISVNSMEESEKGLMSIDITHLFMDKIGRMWVSTRFGGLNIYDSEKNKFIHYKNIRSDPQSLRGENVTSFAENNLGNIWIGADGGGINYFDRQAGLFSHIVADPANPNGLTNDKVLALCLDSQGLLWIGMWGGGVNVYNPETRTFRHYLQNPADITSLSGNNIFYIYEDSRQNIWITTWGNDGICRYDRENDSFVRYRNIPGDPGSLSASGCVMITEDHMGNLWIPTEGAGLNMYDPKKDRFEHYVVVNEPGQENKGLSNLAVYCVFEDSKHRLWVGTNGGGLNLLDRSNRTFTYFRMSDGLPNDAIYGILEDGDGNLWISTNNGLSKFNPDSLTFRNYDVNDGLQSNQFGRWAFKKLGSGELLFGGVNGFNLFNPRNVKENPFVPPVYITGFKLFNQPVAIGENSVLKQHIIVSKEIALKPRQNVFSFEFVALNYRQSEKNQYKYKMEGFNDDWIDLGSQREASFTNLNPGRYTFRVKASNNDGIWNEEGASINVVVIPPWYKTWLFRILLFLAIAGTAVYVVRAREKSQKEMKAYLEQKVREGETELQQRMQELESHQRALQEKEIAERESNWFNEGMAKLGEIVSRNNDDLNKLARKLIPEVVSYVDASLGALYIVTSQDEGQSAFELAGSYGIGPEKVKQRFELTEGYLGACQHEKTMIALDDLPENYSVMESGLGRISLKHLLLIPLLHDNQVNGIMEISSLNKIESFKIRLLEKLAENLASTVQIIHVGNRMKLLVDQLNSHTEELNAQQEEMKQNLEELQATQEEIDRIRSREKDRDKELLQQNEELLKRQEELKELKLKYSALQKKVSKTKS